MKTVLTQMFRKLLPKRKHTTTTQHTQQHQTTAWRPAEAPHHGTYFK